MKHFALYCVTYKEFIGMGLPDTQDVSEEESKDDKLIVNCLFRYKEVEKDDSE